MSAGDFFEGEGEGEGEECIELFLACVVVMASGTNFQLKELSGSANGLSGSDQISRGMIFSIFSIIVGLLNVCNICNLWNKKYFKLYENEFFSSFLC